MGGGAQSIEEGKSLLERLAANPAEEPTLGIFLVDGASRESTDSRRPPAQ